MIGATFVTPRTDQGMLEGTTQHALFEILDDLGLASDCRYLQADELTTPDGLWLVSSGQQIAPATNLDGRELPIDADLSRTLLKRLQARTR